MKYNFTFIFLSLVLLKIIFLIGYPVFAIGFAGEDDRLYINYANYIEMGQWLGPYNNWTLAKGMFFSFWLALLDISGISYLIGVFSFYALSVYYFYHSIRSFIKIKWILYLFTIILLYNPYVECINRVVREGIYPTLSVFIIAAIFHILKRAKTNNSILLPSVICGVFLGCFWNTREEGIWILPLFILSLTYTIYHYKYELKFNVLRIASLLKSLAFVPLIAIIITGSIAGLNYKYYGTFTTVDFKSANYQSAYASLNRVMNIHSSCRHVPVNKETRELIYNVSPTFKILSEQLETPNYSYQSSSCDSYKCSCGDYAGGWFMWAFRLAAAQNGFYKDATTSEAFFLKVSEEIDGACEKGALSCYKKKSSLVPSLIKGDLKAIYQAYILGIKDLRKGSRNSPIWKNSIGSDQDLALFRKITNTSVSEISLSYQPDKPQRLKLIALSTIKIIYDYTIYPLIFLLCICALLILPFLIASKRKAHINLLLFTGILSIILFRLLILSVIHATSFPGVSLMYMSPLYSITPILGLSAISVLISYSENIEQLFAQKKTLILAIFSIGFLSILNIKNIRNPNIWTSQEFGGYHVSEASTDYVIDAINGTLLTGNKNPLIITDKFIIIEGWAIDNSTQNTAANIFVEIDNKLVESTNTIIQRPDLATLNPKYLNSGYRLQIPISKLRKGTHELRIMVLNHAGDKLFSPVEAKTVQIRI